MQNPPTSAEARSCSPCCRVRQNFYRRQIALGLDGAHPQIMAKARLAIRELLGQIRLEPGEDGSLWAAYEVHPAVLVRDAVSGYAG